MWKDPNHKQTGMRFFGTYEIKQQGDYIFIPDLQAGGAFQKELGTNHDLLQLVNRLVLPNLK